MNHCTQGPQTLRTRAAAETYLDSWQNEGVDWDAWLDEVDRARAAFASLINAQPNEIAVTTSLSAAATAVASACRFDQPRRRIVLSEAEFPTVGHAWLAMERYGAELDWIPVENGVVDPAEYERRIDERTLAVVACHASFQNGAKQDVETISGWAHERGAFVFCDAYQTVGIHAIDVRKLGVDFLAAGNLKFLLGMPGIAFLYVRQDAVERFAPTATGWLGRQRPFDFDVRTLDYAPTASRFNTGTPPLACAYVARAGMEILQEVGTAPIQAWTDYLSERLLRGAIERGLEVDGPNDVHSKTPLTAIVCERGEVDAGKGAATSWTARPRRPSDLVEERLRERGVLASARGRVVRLTPHFYNTTEEVDRALDIVAEVVRGGDLEKLLS